MYLCIYLFNYTFIHLGSTYIILYIYISNDSASDKPECDQAWPPLPMRYATHFCSMTSWQAVDHTSMSRVSLNLLDIVNLCDKLPAIQDRGTVPVGRSGGPLGICPDRCNSHTTKSQCKGTQRRGMWLQCGLILAPVDRMA